MTQKYPAVPAVTTDPNSLRDAAMALKEGFEVLTQQRGNRANSAVTWQDLVNLGLITSSQIPKTPNASGT